MINALESSTSEEDAQVSARKKNLWPEDIDEDFKVCRMGRWFVRVWNNSTFSYMDTILKKGADQNRILPKNEKAGNAYAFNKTIEDGSSTEEEEEEEAHMHLSSDDLYPVPRKMQSSRLVETFESVWQKGSKISFTNEGSTKRSVLLKSLWKIASPTFVPAGIFQLISVIIWATLPLIVRQLLLVFEEGVDVVNSGLRWSAILVFATIIDAFSTQQQLHQSVKSGVALRSAIVNVVYKHVLLLSPRGKEGMTSGEINNLVAVDSQKLADVTQDGHLIWSLPLSVALTTWFLWHIMGPSTLVGMVTLVAFVPIVKLVVNQLVKVRANRVKFSDERVQLVSSMLMGMRTTKLNGYESKYKDRIECARNKEIKLLGREQAWWASTLFITVSSSVLSQAMTFATYVLTSTEENPHVLTAADTFAVLLLLAFLRGPIAQAGKLIGDVAQATSAIDRLVAFLERPLRETRPQRPLVENSECDISENSSKEASMALVLTGARFRVGLSVEQESSQNSQSKSMSSYSVSNKDLSSEMGKSTPVADRGDTKRASVSDLSGKTSVAPTDNGSNEDSQFFTVGEFDFEIGRGEVMVVCGPVGSGKTTLLNGILGEAEEFPLTDEFPTVPMVQKEGRISYAPQAPFILNLSLRENILFGSDLDPVRYNNVLDACALRPDIIQLGGSDLVQIGERGITLSGGQRQRVSLARAAYKAAESACVILDDPFSALDSGTGKIVFERLISGPDALLKSNAVLLVTHASHFISHSVVDKILLMVNGNNEFLGTWDELISLQHTVQDDDQKRRAITHIQSQVREEINYIENDEEENNSVPRNSTTEHNPAIQEPPLDNSTKIMQNELREHGLSDVRTWLLWFKHAGGVWFGISIAILLAIDRVFYVVVEYFLAYWAEGAYEPIIIFGVNFDAQIEGLSAQAKYLKVFFAINFVSILGTALRSEFVVTGGVRATKNVFDSMLGSMLRAPMSYFETVPMGRILNRFTYDTDVNDVLLTQMISIFIIQCSWFVAAVVVQLSILPWSALIIVPVIMIYTIFMQYYRLTGPDLQRIDAMSRSPMQSMVSECLEGSTSIRVFHQDPGFIHKFHHVVDTNSSALLNYVTVQRWLSFRTEVLGALVILTVSFLMVLLNDRLDINTGLTGLLICWSAYFTSVLSALVDSFSETEAAITAIERVDAMAEVPSEKHLETSKDLAPPKEWPSRGELEFRDVSLRYRDGLPLALDGLSFTIPAGKTCGIVGRTGAGKSSITVALFRLVEIERGSIILDGVDLTKVGLSDVRGRGMFIIPQDPFLTGDNLRDCLDPFGQKTDAEIMDALEAVRMGVSRSSSLSPTEGSKAKTPEEMLATKLEEGGSNYSVGERQLLNLARALLVQPRVLVLDEATSSIDGETDDFIQQMLRIRFPDTTLLTIAHRLNTVVDYDCVLVLDNGKVSEFDSPANLLENHPEGIFSQLVDATGAESSKALREMAIHSRHDHH